MSLLPGFEPDRSSASTSLYPSTPASWYAISPQIVCTFVPSGFTDGDAGEIHCPTTTARAIWFEEQHALMTGDALATRNPLTGRTGPQIAPDGLNRDSERALRSLDELAPLPVDLVLTGHGEPWTGGIAGAVRLAKLAGRS